MSMVSLSPFASGYRFTSFYSRSGRLVKVPQVRDEPNRIARIVLSATCPSQKSGGICIGCFILITTIEVDAMDPRGNSRTSTAGSYFHQRMKPQLTSMTHDR